MATFLKQNWDDDMKRQQSENKNGGRLKNSSSKHKTDAATVSPEAVFM